MSYDTRIWGAVLKSIIVAIRVKSVKAIRQSLSRTMAAYFQSLMTTEVSSFVLIVSVITLNKIISPCSFVRFIILLDFLENKGKFPWLGKVRGCCGRHCSWASSSRSGEQFFTSNLARKSICFTCWTIGCKNWTLFCHCPTWVKDITELVRKTEVSNIKICRDECQVFVLFAEEI